MLILLITERSRQKSDLRSLLKEVGKSIETTVVTTPLAALQALQTTKYDGVLFDIKLPARAYVKVMRTLGTQWPPFAFVTTQPQFAIDAFELGAIDYIIKPVAPDRLELALERMEAKARSAAPAVPLPEDNKIVLRDRDNVWLLKPKEIQSIQAVQNYCKINFGKEHVLIRRPLKLLSEKLAPHGFFRISRDWIVNIGQVEKCSVTVAKNLKVRMNGGMELDMSRRQTLAFRQLFTL
ncbi:MAG: LytTR family DNA-binding domain-containing protein [Terrimicrobiaceae bacterium]|nr:LytTR family DNA-binding domain-containing protein [Terrimicrobiaceae bacterium]